MLEHGTADRRADIYSLGVLLYHLVTTSYPVRGASIHEVRDAHIEGRRTRLRDERADLPDAFVQAVERAIHPDPLRRFDSIGEFEAALSNALMAADSAATPTSAILADTTLPAATATYVRSRRRHLLVTTILAAVGIIVLAVNVADRRDRVLGRPGQPGQSAARSLAGAGNGSLTVRQVLAPGQYTWLGRPSLDGRYYPFVNGDGDLAVKEMATSSVRTLTARGESAESAAVDSAISPDGRFVAYSWSALDGVAELRIISIDGAWPRVLLRRADVDVPHAIEWSRDGSELLTELEMKDGTLRVALINVAHGGVRMLRDFGTIRPLKVSLSPDGRFVAFDRPQRADRPMRDIFVMTTDGRAEWPLIQHPANDLFPEWFPDGTRVLFDSDRTGTLGLWMVRVAEGRTLDEPQVVSPDMGHMRPLGLTRDGALFYHLQTGLVDVFTQMIDPSTLTTVGKPEPVSPNAIGSNISSGWSRDGRQLAYVSVRSPVGSDRFSRTLSIRDAATGAERVLWPALAFFMTPA